MNDFSNTNNGFLLKKDYDPKKESNGKSPVEDLLTQKRRKLSDTMLGPVNDDGETREDKKDE